MKEGIHPDYKEITIVRPNGTTFVTRSTYSKSDRLQLDIDPTTHPAWTGGTAKVSETGRVSKFNARFKVSAPAAEAKTAEAK